MNPNIIEIYTDGSCHTKFKIGAWAAILFVANDKILLKGEVQQTTHNRMELLAVIKAIAFANENYKNVSLVIYTDSQYVSRIPERKEKLKNNHFITKDGNPLQNLDLLKTFICQIEAQKIEFIKVKAHQKLHADSSISHINYNSEVDKLVRQMVRKAVKNNQTQ